MKVDLREKLKANKQMKSLPKNHRDLFEERLDQELHQTENGIFYFLKIAAAVVLVFGLGYFASTYNNSNKIISNNPVAAKVSLGDFSPELKKIENYYLTAINYELANLNVNETNKIVLEKYLNKLNTLTKEYKALNSELSLDQVDEELINNLIDNLQLRLHLLMELKNELKKFKNIENENIRI